jgi:beta-lactamase regulating signal transducer with metallopeptidase domain/predicted  nucleic acid-binding Zn-ribbon protein
MTTATLVLAGVWAVGLILALCAIGVSFVRVGSLSRRGSEVLEPAWRDALASMSVVVGLRRPPRLVVSARVGMPMAGGIWRPTIFLPPGARAWSAEWRDVVLAHELVHLGAWDPLRHLVARLALAAYWFHPLAWMAARRADEVREHACDQAVLALGTRPSAYARVLLELADTLHVTPPLWGALPWVPRPQLERRLMDILTPRAPHAASLRLGLAPVLGFVLLVVAVAAAHPAASSEPSVPPATVAPAAMPPRPVAVPPVTPAAREDVPRPMPVAASSTPRRTQTPVPRMESCLSDASSGGYSGWFRLGVSVGGSTGRTRSESVGRRGGSPWVSFSLGSLRLCLLADGAAAESGAVPSTRALENAPRIMLEALDGEARQRLEITRSAGGETTTTWRVNGVERRFDDTARVWRDRMLAVLGGTWEMQLLRDRQRSLKDELSAIMARRTILRNEIASLRGEARALDGQIKAVRSGDTSLRDRVMSIRAHARSLDGALSVARRAVSRLQRGRVLADHAERARIDERLAEQEAEIARLERELREYDADARVAAVEQERAVLNVQGKVAALQSEIAALDLDQRTAGLDRRIAELDVERRAPALEAEIAALDADRRVALLMQQRDRDVASLRSVLAR